ncbi:TonB-dependent receptor [Flavobacterium noncentrifugens]|uniref:Outer membrane receptor proteins, mostly Fe transport n=1 Tax=Flavobacterium noncentrifugens TaxID=1128970 RepID=A0A1G9D798_9FLAO|nr:outer membrane beta-barrel family protein [Flavobacterium noncentrifugens]GEP52579.1 TonB-dependent receptor [Flavobacterium noncentrifugens]SDK59733.1 Outer membrane receptor proteins, mostly Fe transport [Flavobacterium noncentrifugens]
MKKITFALFLTLLLSVFTSFAQERPAATKVKVTGNVTEKISKQPLEYATITLTNTKNPKSIAGGITNNKGEFDVDVTPGTYDIKVEFISFKATEIKSKNITENTNLGTVGLDEDATQLQAVEVRAEATTVQIKLDKKVYSVGQDLLVKGGTVSDVLDNIPSVTVDADGTIALRGNDNVRILIDGRPSNAINISEALRQIPADAIDKVEVVTNPSARYDSEGGGGLLNIILKKGKNQGINGTIILSAGDPKNYGVSGNVNYKTEQFNLYTTTGYSNRQNNGNSRTDSQYFLDGVTSKYTNERRENERSSEGYNSNVGLDWYLDKSTTWSNSINVRRNSGGNPETVITDNFNAQNIFQYTNYRFNDQFSESKSAEFNTNFVKNFTKEGHKLTIDGSFSSNRDNDNSEITDLSITNTANVQTQQRNIVQTDYVLPLGKASQFEAGYKGDFNKLFTDYKVDNLNAMTGLFENDYRYTNVLDYREQINALYSQFGTKINKFSILLGLRWEDSKITINQLTAADFSTKKYNNFFPSAFFTYEVSDKSSVSLNYSRRISRPRGRFINPFSSLSSAINIFKGNPNLDPSLTDAFDLGFLKRWSKLTLSTSAYINKTTDSFQFVRSPSGEFVDGTPVIYSSPVNLGKETRFGFEFTLNYNPFKWWKLNSNFNFFRNKTEGEYSYTVTEQGLPVTVNESLNNTANSWFTRLSSKISLPYKIDWQTNFTYNGPQNTAQGKNKGNGAVNLGFSKDLLKDKATIALNVQDLFNSRKRITETYLESLNSYSEMQWRTRQATLSFTYRFNQKKGEKQQQKKRGDDNGGSDEFPG